MKRLLFALALATLSFLASTVRAHAQEEDISFQTFYDALTPYGDWINVEGYGYCWHPSVDEDWTPYTDGNWAYTDAGWTWCGDEAWSWAPYHYGRWTQLQDWGWIWVPGYEWAPAWVSWRYGEDYIGWAPLPPTAVWVADVGFNSTVDVEYSIAPGFYSFCPIQSFGARQLRPHICPYWNNSAIFNTTRNITRIARNGNSVFIYSGGPNFAEVNQHVEQPFQQLHLEPQRNVDPRRLIAGQGRNYLQNNVLQVVAPPVVNATAHPQSIAANVPRQQAVRLSDRIPPSHRQGNPTAIPNPAPNTAPPTADSSAQGVPLQPYEPGHQNGQGHHERSDHPTPPNQTQGTVSTTTPPAPQATPSRNPGYSQPNLPPGHSSTATASGTIVHQPAPADHDRPRPQTQPQGNAQATTSLQAQQPIPTEEQARRLRAAQLAQQQAAQQQAAQQQAAQQQAAQQQAAQQQAAQQQAAQQQAAQQRAAQQQAAPQGAMQPAAPQPPPQAPGDDGRHRDRGAN